MNRDRFDQARVVAFSQGSRAPIPPHPQRIFRRLQQLGSASPESHAATLCSFSSTDIRSGSPPMNELASVIIMVQVVNVSS
jgi:hypothetical protein